MHEPAYELMNPLTEVCPLGEALTLQATLGYNHRRAMATDSPGILIVDDNEDNRYTLQLMLETDGHERIASAAGGNEAIALIEKEKFSLILLDLMMPDLNGDEVLKVKRSGQARYPGRHDQRRHERRQGFAMHRARRRRLSA
jgi:Response regulator receiver domain